MRGRTGRRFLGRPLRLLALGTAVLGVCFSTRAQAPVITSFSQNGVLVCSNLYPGSTATVQWASALTGTWSNLLAMTAGSNQTLVAEVPIPLAGGPIFYRVSGVAAPAGMGLIPAGSFMMGDNLDGSGPCLPLHTVYVSAFYMDRNEVTKALWDEVKSWNGGNGYSYENAGAGKAPSHPVQTVNWRDCVKWCNARSENEGLTPCYYNETELTTVYKTGEDTPYPKWDANGYRLPTEAEWEKAARGGASGWRFPWGDTVSWHQANYFAYPLSEGGYAYDINPTVGYNLAFATGDLPYTSPVGYFAPNRYGLYDMAGNIYEWCWDWFDPAWYADPGATENDTRGPSTGRNRLLRGGDYFWYADSLRCASRYSMGIPSAYIGIGFRCVRGL